MIEIDVSDRITVSLGDAPHFYAGVAASTVLRCRYPSWLAAMSVIDVSNAQYEAINLGYSIENFLQGFRR